MAKLSWDDVGKRLYETGTDHGVVYPQDDTGAYPKGYAWNGLTGVTESPSGAEPTDLWADNMKYLSIRSAEDYGITIEAFMYPPEFAVLNGEAEPVKGVNIGQQTRKPFGLSYRTILGNDTKYNDYGYKLHLTYGCTVSPSEKAYQTVNDSPDAVQFSWEATTVPVPVTGYKPAATLTIDSTTVDKTKLAALETILYGSDEVDARLPLPDEVIEILTAA